MPTTPDSAAVRALREYRVLMDALDTQLVEDMGKRWLGVELALEKDMLILAQEFERRIAANEIITSQMINKSRHYQVLQSQIQAEVLRYNKEYAVGTIADAQRRAAILGINAAQESIYASYPSAISANFDKLNVKAVESLIGISGDGKPLKVLLDKAVGESADGVINAMLAGLGKGQSAFQIAKDMANGLGLGFDRSLLIARTETNRAYRSATIQQYRESGVVTGFYRLVQKAGACLGCLALDGEEFELASELSDHPRGRCTAIAKVRGVPPPEWEKGPDWLANQSEEKQREILGNTRYEMYKNGTPLSDMVTRSHSSVWGDAPAVKPLSQLTPP